MAHTLSKTKLSRIAALRASAIRLISGRHWTDAKQVCEQLLFEDKSNPDAYMWLGLVCFHLSLFREGYVWTHRATRLGATDPKRHLVASDCLAGLEEWGSAVKEIDQYLAVFPDNPLGLSQKGTYLMAMSDYPAAIQCFRQGIAVMPSLLPAFNNIAMCLKDMARGDEAIVYYERSFIASVTAEVQKNLTAAYLYADQVNREGYIASRQTWVKRYAKNQPVMRAYNDFDPGRRLRVGVVSSDFRDHPVGRNFSPYFLAITGFDWFCYSNTRKSDAITEVYQERAKRYVVTNDMADQEIAFQIRSDKIDVAIYLAPMMDQNRGAVASFLPAPLQISMLDVGAANIPGIDATMAHWAITGDEPAMERLVRLPRFYQHPGMPEIPVGKGPSQTGDGFRFGSFNNPGKIGDAVLSTWREILKGAPNSKLILRYKKQYESKMLRDRILDFLPADQVEMQPDIPVTLGHFAAHKEIDLGLDTFAFNGSTTTFNAAWMGVPTVTHYQWNMMSRYGRMLMTELGMPWLAHDNIDDYIACAVRLAHSPEILHDLRLSLRDTVKSKICKPTGKYLERAVINLWHKRCAAERNRAAA